MAEKFSPREIQTFPIKLYAKMSWKAVQKYRIFPTQIKSLQSHLAQSANSIIPTACFFKSICKENYKAMFTLYRIVKRSFAESVLDRASVHTRTAAFEAVSAPDQYCSAPLLKVNVPYWIGF